MNTNLHKVASGGAAMDRFAINTLRSRGHRVKIGCHNSRVELLLNKYQGEFIVFKGSIYRVLSKDIDSEGRVMFLDMDGNIKELCRLDDKEASRLIRKIFKQDE